MKTIIEWLGMLPEPMKSQSFENALEQRRMDIFNSQVVSLSRAINDIMTWSDTPQGEEYWSMIHDACDNQDNIFKAPLTFSSSMRNMLKSMRGESIVAMKLYERAQTHTDFANYITMRGEMCSYLPNGREHVVNENGKWARNGRQDMKPVKMARNLLHEHIADDISATDYEKFSNLIKSYIAVMGDEDGVGKKMNLHVIQGNGIIDAYHVDNYSTLLGTDTNLFGSCMRHDECANWLDIYSMNKDNVSMLVALDNNDKVLGRAILWSLDCGKKAMDTIYAHESLVSSFIQWAHDNNYYYKSRQSCHHEDFDKHATDGHIYLPKITLKYFDFDYYPYMDTLSILTDNVLGNEKRGSEYKILKSTDGSYEDCNTHVYDIYNGEEIDEDDARYLDYRRPNGTHIEGYVNVDSCLDIAHGGWVLSCDCVDVDGDDRLRNDENICYVEYRSEWHLMDNCYTDYDGDMIHCDDAVELHDCEYAHEDDAHQCMVDGLYYLKTDMYAIDCGYVANVNMDGYLNELKNLNKKNDAKYNETKTA
jgi:hypothetical protein